MDVDKQLEDLSKGYDKATTTPEMMLHDALDVFVGPHEREHLYRQLQPLLYNMEPVLIIGESGSGKELVAKLIHHTSPQSRKQLYPMLSVNVGAITESLIESELFGAKRGAFTGADRDRKGLFSVAGSGTLFLDEIGDATPGLQVKLLRALETRKGRAVGATEVDSYECRIIAATNRRATELAGDRKTPTDDPRAYFRRDLYYRLSTNVVTVRPLLDRKDDTECLVKHFLKIAAERIQEAAPDDVAEGVVFSIDTEAMAQLKSFGGEPIINRWPGNVRQLRGVVLYAASMAFAEAAENGGSKNVKALTVERKHLRLRPGEESDVHKATEAPLLQWLAGGTANSPFRIEGAEDILSVPPPPLGKLGWVIVDGDAVKMSVLGQTSDKSRKRTANDLVLALVKIADLPGRPLPEAPPSTKKIASKRFPLLQSLHERLSTVQGPWDEATVATNLWKLIKDERQRQQNEA